MSIGHELSGSSKEITHLRGEVQAQVSCRVSQHLEGAE
jgi:hypothetical protein